MYIKAFTEYLGLVFDALLYHMVDAPALPVSKNIPQFLEYIEKNDRSRIDGVLQSLYSAYPTLTVQDILGLAGDC